MVRPLTLDEALKSVDSSKRAWDKVQPLGEEAKRRLWQKLRLEWNYNSNHIEGNTLTYGETELLLIFGQTDGRHSIREFEEMKAHDVAIAYVQELAAGSRVLTEADIRDLNRMILKEPFWKTAVTSDGEETRKRVVPGDYKSSPNNVRTATGEIFHFADPLQTPAKMHELVAWLQQWLANGEDHICRMISRLHHEFVLIHPFDDGNGRVARLLVNYVLMRAGFPPVIIKSKDKQNYLSALNQADIGNLDAFALYLANEMIWSLNLGLLAAAGRSVEEADDLDKEIAIFAKQHQRTASKAPHKSPESLGQCSRESWIPLIEELRLRATPLASLFATDRMEITQNQSHSFAFTSPGVSAWKGPTYGGAIDDRVFTDFPISPEGNFILPSSFKVEFLWSGFSSPDCAPFDYETAIELRLAEFSYSVLLHRFERADLIAPYNRLSLLHGVEMLAGDRRYDVPMNSATINEIAKTFAESSLDRIQQLVALKK